MYEKFIYKKNMNNCGKFKKFFQMKNESRNKATNANPRQIPPEEFETN